MIELIEWRKLLTVKGRSLVGHRSPFTHSELVDVPRPRIAARMNARCFDRMGDRLSNKRSPMLAARVTNDSDHGRVNVDKCIYVAYQTYNQNILRDPKPPRIYTTPMYSTDLEVFMSEEYR